MITSHTKLNAVIGAPLTHSLSPALHSCAYELLGIDAVFLAFELRDTALYARAAKMLSIGLTSVTMPHKQSIMRFLDSIDEDAKKVGAVNTVINRDGTLTGYNTDIEGIRCALEGVELRGKRILVLGAGGAARTCAHVVASANGSLFIRNRDTKKARQIANDFNGSTAPCEFPDIIINATPIGMHPDTNASPLPDFPFTNEMTVFDCVYNPVETRLLRDARVLGARTISGADMFLAQALAQIELWTASCIPKKIKQTLSMFLKRQLHQKF